MAAWGVYLVRCVDRSLYCGVTTDIKKRICAHNSGTGAKYTRARRPVRLVVYSGDIFTRSEALHHEWAVKRLRKDRKIKYLKELAKKK